MTGDNPILSMRHYRLVFDTFDGIYQALDDVGFDLRAGESLGIVGETGCGKSITAKSILGLLPSPPARVLSGEIRYRDQDLLQAKEREFQRLRGTEIAMIFQDPMTYLNPVFTVGDQLVDAIKAHQRNKPDSEKLSRAAAKQHALDMLAKVHLPNPRRQFNSYPHELSGGMRQRVLIAMSLSGSPKLLIADEPTTALDVTIQAQILDLIAELVEDLNLSVLMISHDLGVVAKVCDRVIVMYAGQIVEDAPVDNLFNDPQHPYTKGLLASIPHPGRPPTSLMGIPGTLPNLYDPPRGCRFAARCPSAERMCSKATPEKRQIADSHHVACVLAGRAEEGGQADA